MAITWAEEGDVMDKLTRKRRDEMDWAWLREGQDINTREAEGRKEAIIHF